MLPKSCNAEEKKQEESFPDGGLQAWSQGIFHPFLHCLPSLNNNDSIHGSLNEF